MEDNGADLDPRTSGRSVAERGDAPSASSDKDGPSDKENDAEEGGEIRSYVEGPGLAFYKGRPGVWAFTLHRVTGVAIFLFLLIHIADVATMGWGREAYNAVHKLYETLFFRILEVGLFGAILLHAINGLRVAIVDFWEEGAQRQEMLTAWAVAAFVVLFVPGAVWMVWNYFAFSP